MDLIKFKKYKTFNYLKNADALIFINGLPFKEKDFIIYKKNLEKFNINIKSIPTSELKAFFTNLKEKLNINYFFSELYVLKSKNNIFLLDSFSKYSKEYQNNKINNLIITIYYKGVIYHGKNIQNNILNSFSENKIKTKLISLLKKFLNFNKPLKVKIYNLINKIKILNLN
jgi:hypothetical protein